MELSRLAVGPAAVLSALVVVASIGLPMGLPVFRFPHPGRSHKLGTLTYHWVDTGRPEIFTADPNSRRIPFQSSASAA